ncbi:MAG: hypothetical protein ACTSUT_18990 [Promethearchaeota archaeon]
MEKYLMEKRKIDHQFESSVPYCDYIVKNQISQICPRNAVDFGAGAGKYCRILRDILGNACHITAIEGFKKAADMLRDKEFYDLVYNELLEEWLDKSDEDYDLAILGDVLEHLRPRMIRKVLKKAMPKFRNVIIVVPLHDIYQDALNENKLEIHQAYITSNFFDRYSPKEKHIICGDEYIVMNVLLNNEKGGQEDITRRISKFMLHYVILLLQRLGLARQFVNFLKRHFIRYKSIVR